MYHSGKTFLICCCFISFMWLEQQNEQPRKQKVSNGFKLKYPSNKSFFVVIFYTLLHMPNYTNIYLCFSPCPYVMCCRVLCHCTPFPPEGFLPSGTLSGNSGFGVFSHFQLFSSVFSLFNLFQPFSRACNCFQPL